MTSINILESNFWSWCRGSHPFHTSPDNFLKKEIFCPFLPSLHTAFSGTKKRSFSKTVHTVESFENAGFSCGLTETEVLEYDDVIHYIILKLRTLCKGRYRISIRFKTRISFENGEKKFPDTRWTRP